MRNLRAIHDELEEARESLGYLADTERFLLVDVGGSGKLTLDNVGRWADELRRCREFLGGQRACIAGLEAELVEAIGSEQDANPEQMMEAT